jgi:hypothetical protein
MEFTVKGIQKVEKKSEDKDGNIVKNFTFMTSFEDPGGSNKLTLKSLDEPEFFIGDEIELIVKKKQNKIMDELRG